MRTPQALCKLFERFIEEPAIREMAERLDRFCGEAGNWPDSEALITFYQDGLPLIEGAMWSARPDAETLGDYQQAFREWEGLIQQRGVDARHRFFVIVPVADRPQHLRNLLDSLLSQCRAFGYGGFDKTFKKVVVVVADDSRDRSFIRCNREIVEEFGRQGLKGIYLGADEQLEILDTFTSAERARLIRILGEPDESGIYHKGASVTRNLAYLLASSFDEPGEDLFLFVDSDEQFKVRVAGPDGSEDIAALNYFHALNRLFTERDIKVATGKVVGDPPVSPAVMAGNFLSDIIAFLERMAVVDPNRPCCFHDDATTGGDAAYHDMARLFGFQRNEEVYAYRCALDGVHDYAACLNDFADRLDRFFDGEHLTRPTFYRYSDAVGTAMTARTVYTGNYVLSAEALKYFIPFADLRLRMAGPTLGRLIQAEIGEGFVAVNLPLLHTRTVDDQSEFRSGVSRREGCVDLAGEFERQFFGDVMLFSVNELIGLGYPASVPSEREIQETVENVEERMQTFYAEKRETIQARLAEVRNRFAELEHAWHRCDLAAARHRFQSFFDNIERNFGPYSKGHALIGPGEHRKRRLKAIEKAIASYRNDRVAWESLLRRLVFENRFVPKDRPEEVAT